MRVFVVAILLAILIPARVEAHHGSYFVAKGNGTYVRTCGRSTCRKVVFAAYGEIVTARGSNGHGWEKVSYGDATGYVYFKTLSRYVDPPSEESASYCVDNTWGDYICAPDWIGEAIVAGADAYGVSEWYMLSLAACESNFNPDEYSWAGAVGIFQFLPDTFYSYGSGDIWSVWDQSYVAASMIAAGKSYQWDCSYRI